MAHWRWLNTGLAEAAWNMAVDEALLEGVSSGQAPTTLRLYGWEPAGVSLGYFQGLEGIEVGEITRRGWGLVRRPTGGRAILHDHEVTYSVCVREEELENGHSVMGSYRQLACGLERALELLGLRGAPAGRQQHPASPGGGAKVNCFARATAGDMVAAGRKIIGSAQMRRGGAILQHGSVPITLNFEDQRSVMPTAEGTKLEQAACGLAELLGRDLSYEELAGTLAEGFGQAFGVDMDAGELTAAELQEAERLAREKYTTSEWTWERRTPQSVEAAAEA